MKRHERAAHLGPGATAGGDGVVARGRTRRRQQAARSLEDRPTSADRERAARAWCCGEGDAELSMFRGGL